MVDAIYQHIVAVLKVQRLWCNEFIDMDVIHFLLTTRFHIAGKYLVNPFWQRCFGTFGTVQ